MYVEIQMAVWPEVLLHLIDISFVDKTNVTLSGLSDERNNEKLLVIGYIIYRTHQISTRKPCYFAVLGTEKYKFQIMKFSPWTYLFSVGSDTNDVSAVLD
jgi:hypothetical protein